MDHDILGCATKDTYQVCQRERGRRGEGGRGWRRGRRVREGKKKKGAIVTVYWEVEMKEVEGREGGEGERRGKGEGGRFMNIH